MSSSPDSRAYIAMMERWSVAAKDLTQLALASLILPIFFIRDVIGIADGRPLADQLNQWFFASWLALGVAITAGLSYQITSARLIGDSLVGTASRPLYPAWQFRVIVAGIIIGIACFVIGAVIGVKS